METPAFGEKFTTYNSRREEAPCATQREELGPVQRQREREERMVQSLSCSFYREERAKKGRQI